MTVPQRYRHLEASEGTAFCTVSRGLWASPGVVAPLAEDAREGGREPGKRGGVATSTVAARPATLCSASSGCHSSITMSLSLGRVSHHRRRVPQAAGMQIQPSKRLCWPSHGLEVGGGGTFGPPSCLSEEDTPSPSSSSPASLVAGRVAIQEARSPSPAWQASSGRWTCCLCFLITSAQRDPESEVNTLSS